MREGEESRYDYVIRHVALDSFDAPGLNALNALTKCGYMNPVDLWVCPVYDSCLSRRFDIFGRSDEQW